MPLISRRFPRLRALVLGSVIAVMLLGGCASNGNPRDPLEPLNRGIYQFNDGVDTVLFKPLAEVYQAVLPQFVRTGVGNFFSNIQDVIVALNNLLQGKVTDAGMDLCRIIVNSTIGILGLIDVGTEFGLEKHQEDFGQTLGRWGMGTGPYIVIPFLGPSTVRDGIGLIGDWKTDPLTYLEPTRHRNAAYGLFFVNRRAELLSASKILEVAALDPYEFVRDAYLQRRRNMVYDGNPPDEDDPGPETKPKPDASGPAPAPEKAPEPAAPATEPAPKP
jgi:phospholipid-binding lipoprotein MlaA